MGMGIDALRASGLAVSVHPGVGNEHFTLAGDDTQRLEAFWDYACRDDLDVLWMARGGYGATRILPALERLTLEKGTPPRKLLVGYSDVTALHEFVHSRWGWPTLHAPMPAAGNFAALPEMASILDYIRTGKAQPAWETTTLKFIANHPSTDIRGQLAGGNLTVWNCLSGTPFAPAESGGRILFFEDVGEAPYRIDRMLTQLVQSGGLRGVKAVILGDFTNCTDEPQEVLADRAGTKRPLRRVYSTQDALETIIQQTLAPLGVAVAAGLPVGHGPHYWPLPLNAAYTLTVGGKLILDEWGWRSSQKKEPRTK
jgi:muramoyltetrapeptide carboxypeptidase